MHASSAVAATNGVELAEVNPKLKNSNEELDLLNKRFDEAQGKSELDCLNLGFPHQMRYSGVIPKRGVLIITSVVAAEVENLKAELKMAKQEAAKQKAVAEPAAAELSMVKTISDKHEAWVAEVQ